MRRTGSIALREFRDMFESPGGYLVIGIFWLVAGLLLVSLLFQYREASIQLAQSGRLQSRPYGLHINDLVIRPLFHTLGSILIFFVPLLTMRSFAEERRTGGLELLCSLPVRGWELLIGKYLGACLSLLACLSILVVHLVVLGLVSAPDWPATVTSLLGLLLLGALFVSIGILLSVLSRSQVEAAVLSLGVLLAFVVGPDTLHPRGTQSEAWLRAISVLARFEDFTVGILDGGHVLFFVGFSLLALSAAMRALDLVRWQG